MVTFHYCYYLWLNGTLMASKTGRKERSSVIVCLHNEHIDLRIQFWSDNSVLQACLFWLMEFWAKGSVCCSKNFRAEYCRSSTPGSKRAVIILCPENVSIFSGNKIMSSTRTNNQKASQYHSKSLSIMSFTLETSLICNIS